MNNRQQLINLKRDFLQFLVKKTAPLLDEYVQQNTAGKKSFTIPLGGSSFEAKLITFDETIKIKEIKKIISNSYKFKKYVKIRIFWEQLWGISELGDDTEIARTDNVLFFTVEIKPEVVSGSSEVNKKI